VSNLYRHCYYAMKEYDQAQAAYAKCVDGPFPESGAERDGLHFLRLRGITRSAGEFREKTWETGISLTRSEFQCWGPPAAMKP